MQKLGRPRFPGRPKGGDSDCRERLLAAALTTFARSGYEGTSLRAIAARAGCDVSMVAHYFGSKRELWQAIVDELAARLQGDRERVSKQLYDRNVATEQRVRRGVEHLFEQLAANQQLARVVLREMSEEGERARYVENHLLAPSLALYGPLWMDAMNAGVFGPVEPIIAHAALIGAMALLIASHTSISRMAGRELRVEELRDEFCQGVLRRVADSGE